MGTIVGTSSELDQPVTVAQADAMIFGYVLLNDWSARDIKTWEYQSLGPFQARAFATSISPWIVTSAEIEPNRTPTPQINLLSYPREESPMLYNINLVVTMAPAGKPARTIAQTNYTEIYYSAAQQLTHHAPAGCPMSAGNLLGSGTISGLHSPRLRTNPMAKAVASHGDTIEKKITFDDVGHDLWAFTADGDPKFKDYANYEHCLP